MLTVRLPDCLKRELERPAAEERMTNTQIVRRALERYVAAQRDERSSFPLGEGCFGRNGFAEPMRSATNKRRVREKLRPKHPG